MFINNIKNRQIIIKNINENCGGGGGCGNNLKKIIHITEPTYDINILPIELLAYSSILYIADVSTNINLPKLEDNILNVQIEIINNSSSNVMINTQNGELMFNALNIKKEGDTSFMLVQNKYCKIISRKKQNLFSWILLIS
jgi:hypothetical protein